MMAACQRRSVEGGASTEPGPDATAAQVVALATSDAATLPEDPVAGARSLAQWREHLEEEERERKANYDRRHLKDHRIVVAFLRSTKSGYDSSKSATEVKRLQNALPPAVEGIRKRIDKIDHWRVSSNLLNDYDALLDALSARYPAGRLGELAGDVNAAAETRRDFDARLKHIDDWLAHAERAEDE
jgi:hypothetical protein